MKTNLIEPESDVADDVVLTAPVRLYGAVRVKKGCRIGKYTYIGDRSTVGFRAHVGNYCSIAPSVEIAPANHPTHYLATHPFQYSQRHFGPVRDYQRHRRVSGLPPVVTRIGNDVWIGVRAVICQGVTIGTGAVIGAGSVVTSDVPPYAIVGGTPARVIRYRFDEALIPRLLASRWWELEPLDMDQVAFDDVAAALAQIDTARRALEARNDAVLAHPLRNEAGSSKGILWFGTPCGYAAPEALDRFSTVEILESPNSRGRAVPLGRHSICRRGFDATKNRYRLQFSVDGALFEQAVESDTIVFELRP